MKREDLFEAIGGAEDDLLEENVAPAGKAGKTSNIPALIGITACIAIAVFGVSSLPKGKSLQPGEEVVEVPMTETLYYNAAPGETATKETAEFSTEEETVVENEIVPGMDVPCPGIWYGRALDSDAEYFYSFREDGTGCRWDAKTGEATDFSYTATDFLSGLYGCMLHLQTGDTQRDVSFGGNPGYYCLSWEPDGASETLLYVTEAEEGFRFCSDAELFEIVGKAHGLDGSPYEQAEFDLVPSVEFPKEVICVTAGEWRGHWYYTVDRLTGEILRKPEL
ncbi:MAG: hypothetical protein IKN55_01995 [Oscillospiraceae bacterium]|nr:hypothetical protein [Oscillospiraceae bacterium]